MRKYTPAVWIVLTLAVPAPAQEPVALIDAGQPAGGWVFDNGREFPGAQGKLELAAEPFRGKPVLSLHGDFTQGGNYVQKFEQELTALEESLNMPYVTSMERIAEERGIVRGGASVLLVQQ